MSEEEELLEALQLANSILEYCGGDSWEMEVTDSARTRFQQIYEKHFPSPEPIPVIQALRFHCVVCNREMPMNMKDFHLSGKPHAKEVKKQNERTT